MSVSVNPATPEPKSGLLRSPEELDTPGHRWLLRVGSMFFNWLFNTYFHWSATGLENVPKEGPLLVTINHLSIMDLPALGLTLYNAGWDPGVRLFAVSKQELFEKPFLPYIMAQLGMFPIYRNQIDLHAMRTMLTLLKRGAALGIAPEGTRSPTGHLQLFQPGVAKLAIQKRLPILPVGLVGMENVMPIGAKFPRRVPLELHIGPVFELTEYYGKDLTPEVLEGAAWDMRTHIAELLPEWMRELPPESAEVRFGSVLSAG